MRILLLVLLVIVLGGGLGKLLARWELGPLEPVHLPGAGSAPGAHPSFEIEATEYDFGVAEPGESVQHDFIVKNNGTARLEIHKGETTCYCTLSSVAKPVLEPGEHTAITLKWHGDKPGLFRQHATVLTNDPQNHSVSLTVFGKIATVIKLVPEVIALGRIPANENRTVDVRLYGYKDTPLAITNIALLDPSTAFHFDLTHQPLTAEELREAEAKSGERITVTLKSGLPSGGIRQTIRLTTTAASSPTLDIPFDAILTGEKPK